MFVLQPVAYCFSYTVIHGRVSLVPAWANMLETVWHLASFWLKNDLVCTYSIFIVMYLSVNQTTQKNKEIQ